MLSLWYDVHCSFYLLLLSGCNEIVLGGGRNGQRPKCNKPSNLFHNDNSEVAWHGLPSVCTHFHCTEIVWH